MKGIKKTFEFNPLEWNTPNTYNKNYKYPTEKPGVYLLVNAQIIRINEEGCNDIYYNILYVGSAKNLNVRYNRHEVLRLLKNFYDNIQFFFMEEINYREVEKELIKIIQPKYNKQWR